MAKLPDQIYDMIEKERAEASTKSAASETDTVLDDTVTVDETIVTEYNAVMKKVIIISAIFIISLVVGLSSLFTSLTTLQYAVLTSVEGLLFTGIISYALWSISTKFMQLNFIALGALYAVNIIFPLFFSYAIYSFTYDALSILLVITAVVSSGYTAYRTIKKYYNQLVK